MSNAPSSLDRALSADRGLADAEARSVASFAGLWEYTVVAITPLGADLLPTSSLMPPLERVQIAGLVGPTTILSLLFSKIVVAFLNQDPSRPYVLSVVITPPMLVDSGLAALAAPSPGPVTMVAPMVAVLTVPT